MTINLKRLIEEAGAGQPAKWYFRTLHILIGLAMVVILFNYPNIPLVVGWVVLGSFVLEFLGIMWLSIRILRKKLWRP